MFETIHYDGKKAKEKEAELPSGLSMMLKAFGLEIDPKMFKSMADAVAEIRLRLQRIEETVNRIEVNQKLGEKEHGTDRRREKTTGGLEGEGHGSSGGRASEKAT